jgi:phosphate-selective porin OprO/OprP
MERAAYQEAFFLDRQIGVGILAGADHWSFQTGVYGAPSAEQDTFFTDQLAYSARLTVAPINREVNGVNQVLHLGVSGRHRDAAKDDRDGDRFGPFDDQEFRYRARANDLHLAERLVETRFISESDDMLNLEAAFVWGPFSMQGEYARLWTDTDPILNTVDPTYNGWYVDASLFLTGETRRYASDEGIFDRVKVKNPVIGGGKGGGWGAWQIAGRYDVIDLTDKAQTIQGNPISGSFPSSLSANCTQCGEQTTWEVVVNWWLNDYTGLQFQYSQSDIEGGPLLFTNAANVVASANVNNKAKIEGFGTRLRFDW